MRTVDKPPSRPQSPSSPPGTHSGTARSRAPQEEKRFGTFSPIRPARSGPTDPKRPIRTVLHRRPPTPPPLPFFEHSYEHRAMATTDRQTATLALAHALSAAEHGLPVIPLSATKLPALRSPHHDEDRPVTLPRRLRPPRTRRLRRHHEPCRRTRPLRRRPLGHRLRHRLRPGPAPPHRRRPRHRHHRPERTPSAALRSWPCTTCSRSRPTVTVITPSGGRHIWLTGPPDVSVPNSASRLAPGIDIRGAGGYLVGPGSVTAHGTYRTRPRHRPPAPRPLPPRAPPSAHAPRTSVTTRPGRAGPPRPGPGPVRSRGTRGTAQHPSLLGCLPRVRTRLRRRPDGRPHRRRRPHRPHRTRGPGHHRLGRPPHLRPPHGPGGRRTPRPIPLSPHHRPVPTPSAAHAEGASSRTPLHRCCGGCGI